MKKQLSLPFAFLKIWFQWILCSELSIILLIPCRLKLCQVSLSIADFSTLQRCLSGYLERLFNYRELLETTQELRIFQLLRLLPDHPLGLKSKMKSLTQIVIKLSQFFIFNWEGCSLSHSCWETGFHLARI